MAKSVIPAHQFTHDGMEVLVVRCTAANGKSHGGFQNPETVGETIEAPDWDGKNSCGGGIHGWPWGLGIGDGKDPDYHGRWYVIGVNPKDIIGNIEKGAKCKFKVGIVRYVGPWAGALSFTLAGRMAYDFQASRGSASNSGSRGSAETTHPGTAAIVTGLYGRARASEFGCIALAWWNEKEERAEMRCALIGKKKGQLKADVWYQLDETGNFQEVK